MAGLERNTDSLKEPEIISEQRESVCSLRARFEAITAEERKSMSYDKSNVLRAKFKENDSSKKVKKVDKSDKNQNKKSIICVSSKDQLEQIGKSALDDQKQRALQSTEWKQAQKTKMEDDNEFHIEKVNAAKLQKENDLLKLKLEKVRKQKEEFQKKQEIERQNKLKEEQERKVKEAEIAKKEKLQKEKEEAERMRQECIEADKLRMKQRRRKQQEKDKKVLHEPRRKLEIGQIPTKVESNRFYMCTSHQFNQHREVKVSETANTESDTSYHDGLKKKGSITKIVEMLKTVHVWNKPKQYIRIYLLLNGYNYDIVFEVLQLKEMSSFMIAPNT